MTPSASPAPRHASAPTSNWPIWLMAEATTIHQASHLPPTCRGRVRTVWGDLWAGMCLAQQMNETPRTSRRAAFQMCCHQQKGSRYGERTQCTASYNLAWPWMHPCQVCSQHELTTCARPSLSPRNCRVATAEHHLHHA